MSHFGVMVGPFIFVHKGNGEYAIPGGNTATLDQIKLWALTMRYNVIERKHYV